MSAPTFVTAGGKTYSTDASATNKLVLKGTKMSSGHDNIGHWTSSIFMYELGTTSLQVHMTVRQYDSFAVFEQVRTFQVYNLTGKKSLNYNNTKKAVVNICTVYEMELFQIIPDNVCDRLAIFVAKSKTP